MRWVRWCVLGALACAPGCRQVFGIDDTEVAGDDTAIDADHTRGDAPEHDAAADATVIDADPPDARPPDALVVVCPTGYSMLPATGTCFRYFQNAKQWAQAEDDCESDGAHLAVVESQVEDQALQQAYDLTFFVWFGLTDVVNEGTYRWVTGGTLVSGGYTNWQLGEPSTFGDAGVYNQNQWRMVPISSVYPSLCEYDGIPADPNAF
jgi:hypothetical protein